MTSQYSSRMGTDRLPTVRGGRGQPGLPQPPNPRPTDTHALPQATYAPPSNVATPENRMTDTLLKTLPSLTMVIMAV